MGFTGDHFYDSSNICILKDNLVEIKKPGNIPQRASQMLNSVHLACFVQPVDSTSILVWVGHLVFEVARWGTDFKL